MSKSLETKRLILREITYEDTEGLFELDSDAEVHRYLGKTLLSNMQQVKPIIDFIRQQYIDYDIGRWAIINKSSNEFIGWCGLKYITEPTNGHINYYDLGYRLIPRFWGKGYASEAAKATLEYGFQEMKLTEIFAIADCRNEKSDRVLKKLGFEITSKFVVESIDHHWYQLNNDRYLDNFDTNLIG